MHRNLPGSSGKPAMVFMCTQMYEKMLVIVCMQVYDTNLESQRQGLQQQLAKRIDDFSGTIAGFGSRWVHGWPLNPHHLTHSCVCI
jgi:hypothetical protein